MCEAKVDLETGKVTIFAEKEVVEDVQDDLTEVTLEEARDSQSRGGTWRYGDCGKHPQAILAVWLPRPPAR